MMTNHTYRPGRHRRARPARRHNPAPHAGAALFAAAWIVAMLASPPAPARAADAAGSAAGAHAAKEADMFVRASPRDASRKGSCSSWG